LIDYRPGGIAPLLAVLFGVPVLLFETQVGRDELAYRILEKHAGPASESLFVNRSLSDAVLRLATDEWAQQQGTSLSTIRARLMSAAMRDVPCEEAEDRAEAIELCDAFLNRYPDSIYVPNVMYLKARAMDLRHDADLLARDGVVQFNTDFPRQISRSTWQSLCDQYPRNQLAAMGLYQAAVWDASQGEFDSALTLLDRLVEGRGYRVAATRPASPDEQVSLFGRRPASSSLGFDPESVKRPARHLRELIRTARDDPLFGDAPLRALLSCDPHGRNAQLNLVALVMAYPGAGIESAAVVRLASTLRSTSTALALLENLDHAETPTPGAAAALFARAAILEDAGRLSEARGLFARLTHSHPASCYAEEARARWTAIMALELTAGPVEASS
jgi:tetratricopeptide (TPR) repeat protein